MAGCAGLAAFAAVAGGGPTGTAPVPEAKPSRLATAAALPFGLTALALVLAVVAGRGLPIWQWDSLGYHLPFVTYALQAGSLAGVPWGMPYLGSYPHAVELWDLGARALLTDDRWLDVVGLPLCLCGAVAAAGLGRLAGAPAALALAMGALWLDLPAIFLQLPSAYVDVPSAAFLLLAVYWLLRPPSLRTAVLFGLAIGLFLASKAAAPAPTALLGLAFAARAFSGRRWALPWVALAILLGVGSEAYVATFLRHGNPLWPVRVDFGPLHLPGPHTVAQLMAAGGGAPRLHGTLLVRLLRAWTTAWSLPSYDMRVGGFGPLFWLALPAGAVGLLRRRGAWLAVALAALLTADPAIARYTFGLPAILLALTAGEVACWSPRLQRAAVAAATALAALGLWIALPGLSGNTGSLWRLLGRPREAQEAALLPAETARAWSAFRAALAAERVIAVDGSFDLSYLLWRPDLRTRVLRVPDGLGGDALLAWLEAAGVSVVVGGQLEPLGLLAARTPDQFHASFACGASEPSCEVWLFERGGSASTARPRPLFDDGVAAPSVLELEDGGQPVRRAAVVHGPRDGVGGSGIQIERIDRLILGDELIASEIHGRPARLDDVGKDAERDVRIRQELGQIGVASVDWRRGSAIDGVSPLLMWHPMGDQEDGGLGSRGELLEPGQVIAVVQAPILSGDQEAGVVIAGQREQRQPAKVDLPHLAQVDEVRELLLHGGDGVEEAALRLAVADEREHRQAALRERAQVGLDRLHLVAGVAVDHDGLSPLGLEGRDVFLEGLGVLRAGLAEVGDDPELHGPRLGPERQPVTVQGGRLSSQRQLLLNPVVEGRGALRIGVPRR